MSGRAAVLGRIRRSLGVGDTAPGRRDPEAARLAVPPVGVVPQRGQVGPAERLALFTRMAEKALATLEVVPTPDHVPEAVAAHLRSRNLPLAIRYGDDPRLATLPWDREPLLAIRRGASDGTDLVGVTRAMAGIAESGTLVHLSGPDNPTTLNFLPETHIAVLWAEAIVGDYEAMWRGLRDRFGAGALPRTVNLITGPSRSGDIEQKLVLGAHGPKHLHILVVATPEANPSAKETTP